MKTDVSVGFIGTGGIAAAIVQGLCGAEGFKGKIFLSVHKSRMIAETLRSLAPERVYITESNQEIIDKAEVIFPTLLPGMLTGIVSELRFREENHIIHVAAGMKLAEVSPLFAPAKSIIRAVPLPFASKRIGPVVFCGEDGLSCGLLSLLGLPVAADTERELEVLASVTGIMVSYYGLVAKIVEWCCQKKMGFQNALDYTCSMNEALSALMRQECGEDVEKFMLANTTPKGMNELALNIMRSTGAYEPWFKALEEVGKHYGL